jgi:hypothetical protein
MINGQRNPNDSQTLILPVPMNEFIEERRQGKGREEKRIGSGLDPSSRL